MCLARLDDIGVPSRVFSSGTISKNSYLSLSSAFRQLRPIRPATEIYNVSEGLPGPDLHCKQGRPLFSIASFPSGGGPFSSKTLRTKRCKALGRT